MERRVETGDLGCFSFCIHLLVQYFKYSYFFYKYISRYIKICAFLSCKTTLYGHQWWMCFMMCLEKNDPWNAAKWVLGEKVPPPVCSIRVLDFIREDVLAVFLIPLLTVRSKPPRDASSSRAMSCSPAEASKPSLKGQNNRCLSYSCQILLEYFINSFLILRFMLHPYGPEGNMCKQVEHIRSGGKFITSNLHHE